MTEEAAASIEEGKPKTPILHPYQPSRLIPGRKAPVSIPWTYIIAGTIVALALAVVVAAVLVPPSLIGQPKGLSVAEQLKAVNDLRGIFLQAAVGTALLLSLLFTWRNFTLSREGQITDRFSTAVAQLGEGALAVRTGAIYALERIAQDSVRDRSAIINTLSAFVRERRSQNRADAADEPVTHDVQAALAVLGRRSGAEHELFRVDLSHCDLRGGVFAHGDWRYANFVYSTLDNCWFTSSRLDHADFADCSLQESGFVRASAVGVHFGGARIKAYMCEANLRQASFSHADLSETDFGGRYDPMDG